MEILYKFAYNIPQNASNNNNNINIYYYILILLLLHYGYLQIPYMVYVTIYVLIGWGAVDHVKNEYTFMFIIKFKCGLMKITIKIKCFQKNEPKLCVHY